LTPGILLVLKTGASYTVEQILYASATHTQVYTVVGSHTILQLSLQINYLINLPQNIIHNYYTKTCLFMCTKHTPVVETEASLDTHLFAKSDIGINIL